MNLPNKLTILRVILVPVFMAFMLVIPKNTAYVTVSALIFIIASLTDTLDGYLARKNGLVTNFGKLMDPLADKMLTTAAYLGLLTMGRASCWAVMLILTREFIVSGIRLVAAGNGTVIAASVWGKAKTIFQMVSIIAAFLVMYPICPVDTGILITNILVWISAVITVISGADYVIKNLEVFREAK
ncbi:MAG: CDP-diacylglycerol--glycerol-3-phosphate 3-phosphatidyltransferase [Clostridia bacterium]|nr:CDP-diacylglycerol--glycerol-3-phosphate 3-phosphatidyltransferase [Clostridia bacterium]